MTSSSSSSLYKLIVETRDTEAAILNGALSAYGMVEHDDVTLSMLLDCFGSGQETL